MNKRAPATYRSDQLEVTMYVGGGSSIERFKLPHEKSWQRTGEEKAEEGQQCVLADLAVPCG